MGQQASNEISGLKNNSNQALLIEKNNPKICKNRQMLTNFQGLLKLKFLPFEHSQKIQIEGQTFFMQGSAVQLSDLVMHRRKKHRKFTFDQVIELISQICYTLAYLQSKNTYYPDLCLSNIFLVQKKKYKLLPPQCNTQSTFNKLKQKIKNRQQDSVVFASPELIIAARCHESQIQQRQILFKSSIFAFGMIMLEICTLKPSSECYTQCNQQIIDNVINQRIQQIQKNYQDPRIARIVANMLDYDFDQRMSPTQIAIWINRQINQPYPINNNNQNNQKERDIQQICNNQQKNMAVLQNQFKKSRIYQQCQEKLRTQTQCVDFKQQKNKQRSRSTRIKQIKSKIVKQKLKNETLFDQKKQINPKSKRHSYLSKSPFLLKQKYLHNPYFNRKLQHQNRSSNKNNHKNQLINRQSYNLTPKKHNYLQDISPSKPLYIQKQKKMNLKYKYNLQRNNQSSNDLSSRQNSYRKYKCDFQPVEQTIRNENQSRLQSKMQKYNYHEILKKSPSISTTTDRKSKYTALQNYSFQPIQDPPQRYQLRNRFNQENIQAVSAEKAGDPLLRGQKNNKTTQIYYERHQKIDFGPNINDKAHFLNSSQKQNQNMKKIRQQILRSRQVIEEVRKSQQIYQKCNNNNYF